MRSFHPLLKANSRNSRAPSSRVLGPCMPYTVLSAAAGRCADSSSSGPFVRRNEHMMTIAYHSNDVHAPESGYLSGVRHSHAAFIKAARPHIEH